MFEHPRFKQVKSALQTISDPRFAFTKIDCTMWAHGANTAKPTTLASSSPWIRELDVPLSDADKSRIAENTEQVVTRDVSGGVTGGKDLKGTQEHPRGYGIAVATAFQNCLVDPVDVDDESDSEDYPQPTIDMWED